MNLFQATVHLCVKYRKILIIFIYLNGCVFVRTGDQEGYPHWQLRIYEILFRRDARYIQPNLGWRKNMEDAAIHRFDIGDGNGLFAVFDGHGGKF